MIEKIKKQFNKINSDILHYFDKAKDKDLIEAVKSTYIAAILMPLSFSFLLILYSYSLPQKFESEATLKLSESISSQERSQGSLGLLPISQFGASMGSKDMLFVKERIDSVDFFNKFIEVEENYKSLVTEYGVNRKITNVRLHKFFKSIINVQINFQTGFLEISCISSDKEFSYNTLNSVIEAFNDEQRLRDKDSIQKDIDYLNLTLQETSNASVQSAVSNIMESKIKKLLDTNNPRDYYLEVISSGFIPERKISPNRYTFLFIGLILGLLIYVLKLYTMSINRKETVV